MPGPPMAASLRAGNGGGMTDVVVLGQIGRDLVLTMAALPDAGGSVPADGRIEVLGGKGANQAVALAQLGLSVALVGVVGDDAAGAAVTAQAAADGIDVRCVTRRAGARTALLVDLVEQDGDRRLVESVPPETLLEADDLAGAADLVRGCRALILQLQQPGAAVRAALALAPATALVVCDGAPDDEQTRQALMARADVVRADRAESQLLAGRELAGLDDVRAAAADLLTAGPRLVSVAAGKDGDLVVWSDGEVLVPLLGGAPVDPTGAGDAYTAALTAALLGGSAPEDAAWLASSAAALTVAHAGGRPALTSDRLAAVVTDHRGF